MVKVTERNEQTGEDETRDEIRSTCLKQQLNNSWPTYCDVYTDVVTKQWVSRDGQPKCLAHQMNTFEGYPHAVLSDAEYAQWTLDADLLALVGLI